MHRVLLIEDDSRYVQWFQAAVAGEYEVECRENLDFLDQGESLPFDAIILDVHIPGLAVDQNMARLADRFPGTPVVAVSVDEGLPTKLQMLALAVDDYLPKTMHADEMFARLRNCIRRRKRSAAREDGQLVCGNLRLDVNGMTACIEEEVIPLTKIEFRIMQCFFREQGKVIRRSDLKTLVWGQDQEIARNNISTHLSNLNRSKLKKWSHEFTSLRGAGITIVSRSRGMSGNPGDGL